MTEEFITQLISERMGQLGYTRYHKRYRDLSIAATTNIEVGGQNELWFIVGNPEGVVVESDYGIYDSTGEFLRENIHQHRGIITITNNNAEARRVTFIQAIIIN